MCRGERGNTIMRLLSWLFGGTSEPDSLETRMEDSIDREIEARKMQARYRGITEKAIEVGVVETEVNRDVEDRLMQARDGEEARKMQARYRGITEKAIAVAEEYGIYDKEYASQPNSIDPKPTACEPGRGSPNKSTFICEYVSQYKYKDEKISITT